MFLGLDVTDQRPRIPRELKSRLRQHYNFIEKFGVLEHSKTRRFTSIPALERHLAGLISFAFQVEPDYAQSVAQRHRQIDWPIIA
jgi:hypothetical protein